MDQNQLEQIGAYVKNHMAQWMQEQNLFLQQTREAVLGKEVLERIITIEQQLKFQNEKLESMMERSDMRFEQLQANMDQRFQSMQLQMDQRFEAMDKRFEAIDKRFNRLYGFLTGLLLTMMTGFITLIIQSL